MFSWNDDSFSSVLECKGWNIPFVMLVYGAGVTDGKTTGDGTVLIVASSRKHLGSVSLPEAKEIAVIALRTYVATMNIALNG